MLNISTESGREVNPNVLKQLTSGERVTVKRLYVDPRETNNYGKVLAAFNDLPRAENTFGYFRRLLILAYQVTIPQEEVDRHLADKLKGELPGILNWVLAYLPGLMNRGEFTSSVSCEKALDQYRLQSDNVRLFVSEQCEQSEYTTIASEVYTAYRNYCIGSSLKPIGKQKFYERLESLGFRREMYANAVYFKLKVNAV
jgi:putative DNA primase/helicase